MTSVRAERFGGMTAREREYGETHREEIAANQRAFLAEHPTISASGTPRTAIR